jgi:hypothetical protein
MPSRKKKSLRAERSKGRHGSVAPVEPQSPRDRGTQAPPGVAKKPLRGTGNLGRLLGKTALAGKLTVYRVSKRIVRSTREDWFGPITFIDGTNWLYIEVRSGKHFPVPAFFFHQVNGLEVTNPATGERVRPEYIAFFKEYERYANARSKGYNFTHAACSYEELFEVYCIG